MSKKAITLIEVIISVVLIVVAIGSLFQIKNNNLNFLQTSKEQSLYNSYIDMVKVAIGDTNINNLKDETIYLSSKINISNLKDDNLRKKLKKIKIKIEEKILLPITFDDKYPFIINIKQTNMQIKNKISKNFYTFSVDKK
jgi:type II secretory pathway pseudopilin PulG